MKKAIHRGVRFLAFLLAATFSTSGYLVGQQPDTTAAFDRYVTAAETRIAQQRNSAFLNLDSLPPGERATLTFQLRGGEVVIEKLGNTAQEVPGGLIHDWSGAVFIPNVTVGEVVSLLRDYDQMATYFSPDVEQSHLISNSGDDFRVFMRLRKHKVVTVVLDTEYNVHYRRIDAAHQYSVSRSTRVSEIEDPDTPKEHALPVGQDHGFMWRLNSYWAFEQAQDGVLVECEAISLTRDIPAGLGWMIGPFVNSIPRESLELTLNATRAAFAGKPIVEMKSK